jgi:hypothetical protein
MRCAVYGPHILASKSARCTYRYITHHRRTKKDSNADVPFCTSMKKKRNGSLFCFTYLVAHALEDGFSVIRRYP